MDFSNIDAIIGVDPGLGGAISMYRKKKLSSVYMPRTEKDLNDYLKYIEEITINPIGFVEHVQARPSDMVGGKAFSIIKMLKQYNELCFCLKSHHLPIIQTQSLTWQKKLKVWQKGEDYDTRKKRYTQIAKDWFPEQKVTKKNADALLILHFGRLMLQNEPDWVSDRFNEDFKLF